MKLSPVRPLILFALLFGIASSPLIAAEATEPMAGSPAPNFRLESLSGEVIELNELRGEFVVLHFATTWCPFCNAEAPHLERIAQEYASRGVQVLTIDVKETKDVVASFVERFGITFPILLDHDGSATAQYAPEGVHPDLARSDVPIASNLIIDDQGVIRFYSLLDTTAFDAKLVELEAKLNELLEARVAQPTT